MDYLELPALKQLMDTLSSRTSSGDVKWRAVSDYHFVTSGKNFTYFVSSADMDDYAPYVFEVWKGDPTGPDSHEDEPIQLQHERSRETWPLNDSLYRLYELVKRKTLNIDGVASQILSDFD